ncbi:MAG: class II aldolase [Spirochaetales bacterium]|mgnify:CR=1 FL=1|jgi:rhamnose utilization protein RhaD (predicted bifunctional aldolase and dehydrogenase)|nr:class II aldolase [Spirochaetales bacterium]
MSLAALIEHSRRYGSDASFVLLGGGNTSYKENGVLYVKASGHALGTIGKEGFVRMDLAKMEGIWSKQYSQDDDTREDEVLKDMMACRLEGETARPSVEALLHALLPFPYVVHLHPAIVNGVTCAQEGRQAVARLFPEALWIELVKPGFILANVVRQRMAVHTKQTGAVSSQIFLQNHGIFVGGASLEEISLQYEHVMKRIESALVRKPDFTPVASDQAKVEAVKHVLGRYTSENILFELNKEYARLLADETSFAAVASSFTPDHIVYAGFKPLWVRKNEDVAKAFEKFEAQNGVRAKIVCVQNLGVFSLGEKSMPLFLDSAAISVYSESFGGPLFMDEPMIDFIRNWEVEKYRSKV